MSGVQVALSLTLLVGALLLARTIHNLYTMDTGMSIDGVAALPLDNKAWTDAAVQRQAAEAALAAVERLPSVTGVALDLHGPDGSRFMGRIGLPGAAPREAVMVTAWPVTPNWFGLLRVRMLQGRPFREAAGPMDGPGGVNSSGPGVVLTASLARRLFGDTRAVGRTVAVTLWHRQELQVVGVTNDIRSAMAPDHAEDAFFVPFRSLPLSAFSLLIRTRTFDARVARTIREAVEAALPGQAVDDPAPLTGRLDRIYSERRIFSHLLTVLSALAVLLAAVGLYGVIAFTAAGRTREFGIRLALGAEAARIGRLVLRDAVGIVVLGTAFGLLGAWGLSALLQSRLFGVGRLDPLSYGAAVLLFAAVAALACWTPARAAMRVDPVETLKSE
jgi:putative ABC transport system permease protein